MQSKLDNRGITLIELILAISLFAILLSGAYFFLSSSTNSFRDVEAQYIAKEQARRADISMEDDIRKAQAVNYGGSNHKAVEVLASGMQLNVYSDVDNDGNPEIVQYVLDSNKLKRGTAELGAAVTQWITIVGRVRNNLLSPVVPIFSIDDEVVNINLIVTDDKERIKDHPVSMYTSITVRSKGAMD